MSEGIKVTIEDDRTKEIIETTHEAILIGLEAAGLQAASIAKVELQKDPSRIDTGLLRNSIAHAVVGQPARPSAYSADSPNKNGDTLFGSYSGVAPDEGEDKPYVMIGTNVEYAMYVHEGTERMAPNRFLKKAIDENKAELLEIVAKVLRNV